MRGRLLGRGQLAVCMRSGIKCHASELVRDGRVPALLVLPEWADEAHPQERPYVPVSDEATPRYPVSPDNPLPNVNPVLAGQAFITPRVVLTWAAARRAAGPRIDEYDVYKDSGAGYVLLTTVTVVYTAFGAITGPTLTYIDSAVAHAGSYSYKVVAIASGHSMTSNVVTLTVP